MKKGDLVRFNSNFGFQASYAPSGIIVGIEKKGNLNGFEERVAYKVLWADGKHTKEWDCYLEKLV
tara:strand:+ start:176 stop:370 length:195 start_codon:yes stop_codon:yes gene_type:complete